MAFYIVNYPIGKCEQHDASCKTLSELSATLTVILWYEYYRTFMTLLPVVLLHAGVRSTVSRLHIYSEYEGEHDE